MASIKRRPDGRWRARYRDETGQEHSRHFDRKVDGQRWLDEIAASVVTGQYVDPRAGKVTLGSFYRDWSARQVWVPSTHRAFGQALADSGLEDTELRALRHSHGEAWVQRQNARGLSPVTIDGRMSHIRAILGGAVRDKVLRSDPFAEVVLPRKRRAEVAMRLPTSAEVAAIMAAGDDSFALVVALAAFAGLRAGEIAGLQVGDVDFLRRVIHVRRQSVPDGVRQPKYESERDLYVPERLVKMISAHVARTAPDPWLFTKRGGGPANQDAITHRWVHRRDKAGLKHLRLHDCRHFYASGLIAAGCDVVTVQRALGHSSATITLAIYSHLWPTAEDRTRTAATGMMSAALDIPADSSRTGEGV
jgi:integrase